MLSPDEENSLPVVSAATVSKVELPELPIKVLQPQHSIEDTASLLSVVFFSFLNPIYTLESTTTLEQPDLGPCAAQDQCRPLYARFTAEYDKEMKRHTKEQRSLWMILWRTVGIPRFLLSLLLYTISAAVAYG